LAAGHLKASDVAAKPVDARSLDRAKLSQASFQRESIHITPMQLIKIRQLFNLVGVPCQPKEEQTKLAVLLAKLRELAGKAGGAAPAPEAPKLNVLEVIESQSGNAQLLEVYTRADDIADLCKAWSRSADSIAKRLPAWHQLQDLLRHAKTLGPYAALKTEAEAIETQRALLAEPDPVRPLLDKVVDLLRQALNAKLATYKQAFALQQQQLNSHAEWNNLSDAQRADLVNLHHLNAQADPPLGTPQQLQDALDNCDLDHWVSKADALSSRFEAARMAAVQLLKPNVVHLSLPKRTLSNAEELKAWLFEVEQLVAEKLKQGPVAL